MALLDLIDASPSDETPIACDASALSDKEEHAEASESLFSEREEVRELDGGYALRFPGTMEYADRALEFVRHERQCCPFLTFEIAFEPEGEGLWLYLGGDDAVKEYLKREFESTWLNGDAANGTA